jgi:HK97 family phage portal protein
MAWWQFWLPPTERKSSASFWKELFGGRESKAGQVVNVRTALETSVVLSAGRVIAEGMAQVPCKVFKRNPDGSRTEAVDHPLYELLTLQPNEYQTAFEFIEQIGLHLALCGNAYVLKNRVGIDRRMAELLAFEPGCVIVTRNPDYSLSYQITTPAGERIGVSQADMWHIRGPSWSGYVGLDMVYQARNAIGIGLATEEFGSGLFKNGARPGGLLIAKTALNPETATQLKEAWKQAQAGPGNAMSTALISGDIDYKPLAQTAEEAQFIETRKMVVHEVCRFMRVLPIMVMQSDDTTSYSSVEQMFLAHLTHTLMPWYRRVEQSITVNLLTPKEREEGFYVKFMAAGMMRGTAKERAEYLQIMRQNKIISANEWRDIEDMDRSTDPEADTLIGAANLYGPEVPALPAE